MSQLLHQVLYTKVNVGECRVYIQGYIGECKYPTSCITIMHYDYYLWHSSYGISVVTMVMKVLHNTCNTRICGLPDMNALIHLDSALGIPIRQIPHVHVKAITCS